MLEQLNRGFGHFEQRADYYLGDEVHEIVQTFSVDLRLIVPQGDQDDGEVDDAEHMPLVRTQFASSLGADVGRNGIDPGGKLGIT